MTGRAFADLAQAIDRRVSVDDAATLLAAFRAEALQGAADWLMSRGHTIAARDLDSYIEGGESRG